MKSLALALVLWVLLQLTIADKEDAVFTTKNGSLVQITMPKNESVSSLLFWTQQTNAAVLIEVVSSYAYNITLSLRQTNLWHFAYIKQPTKTSPLQINVPHDNAFITLAHVRLQEVRVSSDKLVYWTFCSYTHACALLSPITRQTAEAPDLYLLGPLLMVCVLLLATLTGLAAYVCYRRRSAFHHYEKPKWPPLPPPVPQSILQRKDDFQGTVETVCGTYTTPCDDASSEHTYDDWRLNDKQQAKRNNGQERVNSLYGLILPSHVP